MSNNFTSQTPSGFANNFYLTKLATKDDFFPEHNKQLGFILAADKIR